MMMVAGQFGRGKALLYFLESFIQGPAASRGRTAHPFVKSAKGWGTPGFPAPQFSSNLKKTTLRLSIFSVRERL
jgi:hypothetical protein